jgi:hypothetical protein
MKEENQNEWALTIDNKGLHISKAESGRKGYYCPACKQEMIACQSEIIQSHYKHDFRDADINRKCTFSNKTYRHKLAKEELQRIKKIKLPSLYKYPPPGEEGRPYRLRKSEYIHAATVEVELRFYENDLGEIKHGRSDQVEEKHLIIQPDVTFFNNAGKPILFIELVATHKLDAEKLTKLKYLGINTLWVSLPKGSEEEIYETFHKSTRTKWAYHNEEQAAEYIQVPTRNQDNVPEIDDEQRRLFEETFECRASEVNNLIRAIRRSLESESYRAVERRLREELSRVKGAAERERVQLQSIRAAVRARLDESVADRRGAIRDGQRAVSERYSRLEKRYRAKRELLKEKSFGLREEEELVETETREAVEGLGGGKGSFKEKGDRIDERTVRVRADQEVEEKRRDEFAEQNSGLTGEFELAEQTVREQLSDDFKRTEQSILRRTGKVRAKRETIPGRLREDQARIEEEQSALFRRAIDCIEGRIDEDGLPMPRGYSELLKLRTILSDFGERYSTAKRFSDARKSLSSGNYKAWFRDG